MSTGSQVRETGRMLDVHGFTITFGVDHDAVTIDAGSITIPAGDDGFTRHLFAALEAAQAQAGTECTGACCLGAPRPHDHEDDLDADTCPICFPACDPEGN